MAVICARFCVCIQIVDTKRQGLRPTFRGLQLYDR